MRPARDVVAFTAAALVAATLVAHTAGAQQPAADGRLGVVRGVAYDSVSGHPLGGAHVQIVRERDLLGSRSVAADSAGRFDVDSLAPGRYLLGLEHPLLDLLRVELRPRQIDVGATGDTVRVDLGVPGLASVRPLLCGNEQAPNDSSALLAGRVRDAADGTPVANASVILSWSELAVGVGGVHTERRRVPVATRPDGTYLACGVPTGVELLATVAARGRAAGPIQLDLTPRSFAVQHFALGDTAVAEARTPTPTRGTARLTGVVRDAAGRPVSGGRAFVWGTTAAGTIGADGSFSLAAVPAGTRTMEVRALGYAPREIVVDLAPGRANTVDVRLDRAPTTLAPVTVLGTASDRSSLLAEFLERRRTRRSGRFFTAEDIARMNPFWVADVLDRVPGMNTAPNPRFGRSVVGRSPFGKCPALLVLNGLVLQPDQVIDQFVGRDEIVGVEVYPDMASAPQKYMDPARALLVCNVVLFWTRQ